MNTLKIALPLTLLIAFASSLVHANEFESQIEARQAWMNVVGYNVGILGAMTRGKMPYDADTAAAAASNLSLAAQMNNGTMWPMGSDMDSHEGTVAKAALWQNFDKAAGYLGDFASATAKLDMVAGNGLDELKGAMGAVGKTCSGCHKQFRAKK